MAEKSFSKLFNEARDRDSYWTEKAKLQFAEELYELMDRRGVTRSELAALIGASTAASPGRFEATPISLSRRWSNLFDVCRASWKSKCLASPESPGFAALASARDAVMADQRAQFT